MVCERLPAHIRADKGFEDGNVWWPQDRQNEMEPIGSACRRREFWPGGGVTYWRADRSVELCLPGTVEHVLTNILQRDGDWYLSGETGYHCVRWDGWRWIYRPVDGLPTDEERGLCG